MPIPALARMLIRTSSGFRRRGDSQAISGVYSSGWGIGEGRGFTAILRDLEGVSGEMLENINVYGGKRMACQIARDPLD